MIEYLVACATCSDIPSGERILTFEMMHTGLSIVPG